MKTFFVPQIFGSERLDTVIEILSSLKNADDVILDWSKTQILEPAGLALISVLIDQSLEKECKLVHKNLGHALKRKYPQLSKLLIERTGLPRPLEHDFSDSTSFMFCCQGGIDLRYKETLMSRFGQLDEELSYSVQLVFNELIQNAVDHSTSERYYLYFGLLNDEVHFGVLDMGVTLPAKLEQKYSSEDDVGFLELGLKEGTTTRRQRPGGLGLFHTFEMIRDRHGKFVFISRDGQVRRYFAQRKVKRLKLKNRLYGTWVMFTFKNNEGLK